MAEDTILTGRQKKVLERARKRWQKEGMSEKEINRRINFMKKQMRAKRNPRTSGGYLKSKQETEATLEHASEY